MQKNKRQERLYNVLFPIWFLIIFPITWVVILPANFLIDSLVLIISLKLMKVEEWKAVYKASIIKVWLFGFLSDVLGASVLFIGNMHDGGDWWYEYIGYPISWNPFDNIYALLYVTLATGVAGFFIYLFNAKCSFNKLSLAPKIKHRAALALAIITMPYLFLLPSQLIHSPRGELKFFTSHIVPRRSDVVEVLDKDKVSLGQYGEMLYTTIEEGINTADKVYFSVDKALQQEPADYTFIFFNDYHPIEEQALFELPIWIQGENQVITFHNNSCYKVEEKRAEAFISILEEIQAGVYEDYRDSEVFDKLMESLG